MEQQTTSNFMIPDGQITRQLLKMRSGEFDLESIHSLVLRDMGISDLGCIGECSGLERLDLGQNDITKLYCLAGLTNLTYLNLSSNRITSLEGLQSLDNLRCINLSGNMIGSSSDGLHSLTGLEKLEELRLKDSIHGTSNPICLSANYRSMIQEMFPNLRILDGERLMGRGSELFKLCDEIDHDLAVVEGICRDGPVKEFAAPSSWVPDGYWDIKQKGREDFAIEDAEKQLIDLINDCKKTVETADNNLNTLVHAKQRSNMSTSS